MCVCACMTAVLSCAAWAVSAQCPLSCWCVCVQTGAWTWWWTRPRWTACARPRRPAASGGPPRAVREAPARRRATCARCCAWCGGPTGAWWWSRCAGRTPLPGCWPTWPLRRAPLVRTSGLRAWTQQPGRATLSAPGPKSSAPLRILGVLAAATLPPSTWWRVEHHLAPEAVEGASAAHCYVCRPCPTSSAVQTLENGISAAA